MIGTAATIASSMVAGSRSRMVATTGLLEALLKPRSPCTADESHLPYCTGKGWSRPRSRMILSRLRACASLWMYALARSSGDRN
jgi:hypothetical protein